MKAKIVGWGYEGLQFIKYMTKQNDRLGADYFVVNEYKDSTDQFLRLINSNFIEIIIGNKDDVCPHPLMSYCLTEHYLNNNHDIIRLTESDLIFHVFSSGNKFSTGAVNAFSDYLLNYKKGSFQIALVLLPGMDENPDITGRFLTQLLSSSYNLFDLTIFFDSEAFLFRNSKDNLYKYTICFIEIITRLFPHNKHFFRKMEAKFLSVSMMKFNNAGSKNFNDNLSKFIIKYNSIDFFDGNFPEHIESVKEFPRIKKIKENFLIKILSSDHKEAEKICRKEMLSVFSNAELFQRDFDTSNFDEKFHNLYLLFTANPLTFKFLLYIAQYLCKQWDIQSSLFEKIIDSDNIDFSAKFYITRTSEKVDTLMQKMIEQYYIKMLLSYNDNMLSKYCIQQESIINCLKMLNTFIKGDTE